MRPAARSAVDTYTTIELEALTWVGPRLTRTNSDQLRTPRTGAIIRFRTRLSDEQPLNFARAHKTAPQETTLQIRVTPNARGKMLVHHHAYRVVLRLWVSYTPTGENPRIGFYGLHLPKPIH